MKQMILALASLLAAPVAAGAFELHSPDIEPGKPMADTFVSNGFVGGCHGGNLSPALSWSDPPEGTKSFALMVHDPDAHTGGAGAWHWVVINLPPEMRGLARGVGTEDGHLLPPGARQITTDYDVPGWGGPCPPVGAPPHSYNFTVYALKVDSLKLPPNATASHAGYLINLNALDKATLSVLSGR